jgi:hypothetical protein
MTDSRRSGSSSLRSKLREIKLAVIESRRARSAQSRRQLGEPDSTGNFDDSNIRKQLSPFVGSAPQSVFTRNCSSCKSD